VGVLNCAPTNGVTMRLVGVVSQTDPLSISNFLNFIIRLSRQKNQQKCRRVGIKKMNLDMGISQRAAQIEKIENTEKLEAAPAKNLPDVPLAAGLDVAAFGDDPLFVTLPVAQIGAVSRNGYRYAEGAVRGLVEQINAKKPEGRWGHVRPEDRET